MEKDWYPKKPLYWLDPAFNDFQHIEGSNMWIGGERSLRSSKIESEGIKHLLKVNGMPSRFGDIVPGLHSKAVDLEDDEAFEITDE